MSGPVSGCAGISRPYTLSVWTTTFVPVASVCSNPTNQQAFRIERTQLRRSPEPGPGLIGCARTSNQNVFRAADINQTALTTSPRLGQNMPIQGHCLRCREHQLTGVNRAGAAETNHGPGAACASVLLARKSSYWARDLTTVADATSNSAGMDCPMTIRR